MPTVKHSLALRRSVHSMRVFLLLSVLLLLVSSLVAAQQVTIQQVDEAAMKGLNQMIGNLMLNLERQGQLLQKCEQEKAVLQKDLDIVKAEKQVEPPKEKSP